ncbi:hypothetical protein KXW28_004091, partial [Aspergillus fumigatus]
MSQRGRRNSGDPVESRRNNVASGDLDGKLEAEGGKNKCDQKKFGRFKMMSMGRSSSAWETVTVGPAGQ